MRLSRRNAQLVLAVAVFIIASIVSYFSVGAATGGQAIPAKICLAVDISGSMNDVAGNVTKIVAAKNAADQFIAILCQNQSLGFEIAIVSFSSNVTIVQDLTSNGTELTSAVQSLSAWGSTAMGDALIVSVDLVSSKALPTDKKNVILMTDGKSNAGTILPSIAAEYAARNNVVVHTIAFGRDADNVTLQNVAAKTKGKYAFAASGQELVAIYEAMAAGYLSPAMHYGSRILILVALPLLLFLPEIEKGAVTVYKTILGTVMKRPQQVVPQDVVKCPECGHVNRPSARFCSSCRAVLVQAGKTCRRCGRLNRPGARFCLGCGEKLED